MSAKSVEVVRAVFDAAVERDRARVLALHGPEVEYDVTRAGISGVMEETVCRGAWFPSRREVVEAAEERASG